MPEDRLEPNPAEVIDRDRRLTFTFDGRDVGAYPDDTIGSALAADGRRLISRSFKYHRPRGLLCVNGRCPNCLVSVDGVPNVRACIEPVREGAIVRHQNAWPGLGLDIMAPAGRLDRFLPVGFYYKTFIRPRALWPLYERVLRRAAGLGTIDVANPPSSQPITRHLHADVVVVGGGPAGCLAALEAASAGASVILVDDQPELGGHLRYTSGTLGGDERIEGLPAFEAAARLRELVGGTGRIEVLSSSTAFGIYEDGLVGVSQGEVKVRVRARRIVLATGAGERPALFDNNDLPGVMLASGALRLARLYGVRPGGRAVVIADDPYGWRLAAELLDAGVEVVALLDSRSPEQIEAAELAATGALGSVRSAARVRRAGIEIVAEAEVLAAGGWRSVRSIRFETTSPGGPAGRTRRTVRCDLIAMALRPEPVSGLFAHDGGPRRFDERLAEWVPDGPTSYVAVAGEVEGLIGEQFAAAAGVHAGRAAAFAAGFGSSDAVERARVAAERARAAASGHRATPAPVRGEPGKKRFVCVCEDVTAKEIVQAIGEGFDDLETLKRYTTLTMGPCQGKMCHGVGARLTAAVTGRSVAETSLTTARPPFQPVALGTLAGPHLDPVRQTAMHDRGEALGATWTDLGDWKRPLVYRAGVSAECRAVREAVGIIDVSSLGKLDVRGRDAAAFLDWLHPNRFSDLRIGRVRYRAMTDEAGVILDDGTVARLGDERFFVTTTTGSFDAVDQWFRWWLAGSEREVQVTNITSELAAVNLAGPRAREVLARVSPLDVSRAAMPYLTAHEGVVAGVAAIILRIGFVGEVGFEIHVPADYGAFLWDALMDAGQDLGIAPFGVEAQRVLRLEKQHPIIGVDTDALSNPIESGMAALVKAEKPDFIGRSALVDVAARGPRQALVGFEIDARTVPDEGAAIVQQDGAIGRVTSARWSPSLGRTVGLAWLPASLAVDGTPIVIRHRDRTVLGLVRTEPFYDPAGTRLRG